MSHLVRTSSLPACEQLDYWHHLISETFVPLDATVETNGSEESGFRGQLRGQELGPVHACEVTAEGHTVHRTPRLIARGDQDYYKLGVQLHGCCVVTQDGREARLDPGDFAIYDTTRPYTLAFDDSFRMLVLMFPRGIFGLSATEVGRLTATRVPGTEGMGALVSRFLVGMADCLDEVDVPGGVRLANNTTDLLVSVLAGRLGTGAAGPDGSRRGLLVAVTAYIEQHLGDPELTPGEIAAVHHISTRYLHKLFHDEGSTVAGWIRDRRLAHCGHDLRDPARAERPVSAIAAQWGFPDAAHFSRLFKSAFGTPPREYRLRFVPDGLDTSPEIVR